MGLTVALEDERPGSVFVRVLPRRRKPRLRVDLLEVRNVVRGPEALPSQHGGDVLHAHRAGDLLRDPQQVLLRQRPAGRELVKVDDHPCDQRFVTRSNREQREQRAQEGQQEQKEQRGRGGRGSTGGRGSGEGGGERGARIGCCMCRSCAAQRARSNPRPPSQTPSPPPSAALSARLSLTLLEECNPDASDNRAAYSSARRMAR